MRKLTKALSAVLLLAIVVSAFAMFSTFAAEGTTLKPTTTLDLDTVNVDTIAVTNAGKITREDGTSVDAVTMTKVKNDPEDGTYWLLQSNGKAGQTLGNGMYLNYAGNGINPSYTLRNYEYEGKTYTKNVDFFVFDFDVATDTSFFQKFYFHTRQYTNTNGSSQKNTSYPGIYGSDYDSLCVTTESDSSSLKLASYPLQQIENEWVNITFVYDYRGEDPSKWLMYAYIDGYFVGSYKACENTAYRSYFIRPGIPNVATNDYESMKLRNWTYTRFPVGWEGDLTSSVSKLGQYAVTLNEISELNYCLEGTNAARAPIATVQHADGTTTEFTTFDELNGSFVDGDVVTLNRNVATPLLVNASNVTFVDNGYSYKLVDTTDVDFSTAAFVVQSRKTRAVVTSGDEAAFETYFSTKGLTDGYIVTLFKDLEWSLKGTYAYSREFIFDMNGHKLTFTSAKRVFNTADGVGGVLRLQNGAISYKVGADDFTMLNANNAVVFDHVTLTLDTTTTFLDQRNGLITFKSSDIIANKDVALDSAKGNGAKYSAVEIIDSTVTKASGAASMITSANLATSSKRQGGLNLRVDVIDTEINWPQTIFYLDVYANGTNLVIDDEGNTTCTSATYDKNAFDVDVNFKNSYVNSTLDYYVVDLQLSKLQEVNYVTETNDFNQNGVTKETISVPAANAYKAEGLSVDLDVTADNSTFHAYNFTRDNNVTGIYSSQIAHTIDIDVAFTGGCAIDTVTGIVYQKTGKADTARTYDLTLEEGTKLANNIIERNGNKQQINSVTYGNGAAVIAGTSLYGEFGYIVSSAYDTYTYQLGNKAAKAFYWNQAEGDQVDINKVVTTAETALYKYTWANEGKAYTANMVSKLALGAKSNLTLCDYIYFNLFINKAEYDAAIAAGVTVSGITVDENTEIINIDGTDYYKLQIKDIKLEDADKAVMTVGVSFAGAYGDSYASEKIFSVLSYAENILNNSTDEKSVALIESLLNYIVAACNYASVDASAVAEKAAALIDGKEFGAIAGEAKAETLEGVEVAIRYGNVLYLGVKANAGDVITVSYTSADDNAVSVTKTADENGEIYVAIKAYDFASDLTITRGADSAKMNIQGYYNALADDAAAQAMVEAIYNYATAAAAYKATMA